jgi:poly-gamma-glutamate synthesis protein (capsule biosynthesis protein)
MYRYRRDFLSVAGFSLLGLAASKWTRPNPADPITVVAAGDCLITRKLSVIESERVNEVLQLFRDADVGFGNCEMTFHELEGYPAPTGDCGDLNLVADPILAKELAWAGFTMMAVANNHTGDYGPPGILATIENLERSQIVAAGAGTNLSQARAPRLQDTAAGRVALVACASTFRAGTQATPAHSAIRGKPGLSPLRTSRVYRVRPEQLQVLRDIRGDLSPNPSGYPESETEEKFRFLGNRFEEAPSPEVVTEADATDVKGILEAIGRARNEADLVLLSIHAHESGANREVPAAFLSELAKAAIDSGADMVMGHGPHVLRGIEIYRGKPIFYSLGNFLFQAETIRQIPEEIYRKCDVPSLVPSGFFGKVMGTMFEKAVFWESVVPRVRFREGECTEIDLFPIDLRWKLPPTRRGTPEMASREKGEEILSRLRELSIPFGTELVTRDGVGSVVV